MVLILSVREGRALEWEKEGCIRDSLTQKSMKEMQSELSHKG